MKKTILIGLLLAAAKFIYAQNPRIDILGKRRIETCQYQKGGDSISFTIRKKKDTLLTTIFFRNGKINKKIWKRDSCYDYDLMGRLYAKYYSYALGKFNTENAITYHANGQVSTFHSFKKKLKLEKIHHNDGDLFQSTSTRYLRLSEYTQIKDGKGRLISSKRLDTIPNKNKKLADEGEPIVYQYDTLFYDNGRPCKTTKKIDNDDEFLGGYVYDSSGTIIASIPPDSLKLIVFKDNVDCYYGLHNKRGDTIVPPKFDRIEEKGNDFWAAYRGESLIILKPDGTQMPPFSSQLTSLSPLIPVYSEKEGFTSETEPKNSQLNIKKYLTKLYSFNEGSKYGVVNSAGVVLLPPQYFPIEGDCIDAGRLFQFNKKDKQDFLISRTGFINQAGKSLFADRFKSVFYYDKDYFFLSEKPLNKASGSHSEGSRRRLTSVSSHDFMDGSDVLFGLGRSDGVVLIEAKFNEINPIHASSLFITRLFKSQNKSVKGQIQKQDDGEEDDEFEEKIILEENYRKQIVHDGMFDAHSKRWLVDTIGFNIMNLSYKDPCYFLIKDKAHKKYGIMDTTGTYILPLEYDEIMQSGNDENNELFYLKKGKDYQIVMLKDNKAFIHPTKYEFLEHITFDKNLLSSIYYFLAKRNGKWGVIDSAENIIKPFDFDYASHGYVTDNGFLLVKDNQAAYYTLSSLPHAMPNFPHNERIYRASSKIGSYSMAGSGNRAFFINNTGKVIIPPQYKIIREHDGNFAVVEDAKKRKKIIFLETGKIIDYPFRFRVEHAHVDSRIILIKDTLDLTYGVVSTDGKLLIPSNNYGVAIGDIKTSTFFVKQDTPLVNRYGTNLKMVNKDELNEEDTNWKMYNGDGKQLTSEPFRFPIDFKNGVGIGMQGQGFNLYKMDGTILKPFTKASKPTKSIEKSNNTEGVIQAYKNIRRLPDLGFYSLFYNQGMAQFMILTKNDGGILVERGHYDGISDFYGKYALVSAGKKIGLIDTFSREIIAPQDLRTSTIHFMDSLDLYNKLQREAYNKSDKKTYLKHIQLPIDIHKDNNSRFVHPDSLKINAFQRASLWNLMLEQWTSIKTVADFSIPRVQLKANADFLNQQYEDKIKYMFPKKVRLGDSTISFILIKKPYQRNNVPTFHNFYRHNNRWKDLKINDALHIQGEKRWQMNDLITKKVKALKDQQIDCSNTAAFITTVETRWMLTKEGIDFCFDSTENSNDFVVVSFTWAELQPFLKMKLY